MAGFPTVASAQKYEESDDHIQRILNDAKVQAIQEAVGDFDIQAAEEQKVQKGDLSMAVTSVETDVGTLLYVNPDGDEVEVQLKFGDLTETPSLRKRLPKEYRNVPRDTEIILKADPSVSMVRTVTKSEEEKLARYVDGSNEIVRAVYSSEINKYRVATGNPDNDFQDAQRYLVTANVVEGRPTPTQEVERLVTTQGCFNAACASCALWAANRGLCYASCAAGQLYACAACLFLNSAGLAFADCGTCFEKCLPQA